MKPRICLNMIVRDEAAVIQRCLRSVLPFIDSWVIVDTGSRDGTPGLVRDALRDRPGTLHERPWRDFGSNRTEALRLASGHGDYFLFIDADEVLSAPPDFSWPALEAAAYYLFAQAGATTYSRLALVDARPAWEWVGVIHEHLSLGEAVDPVQLAWPRILVSQDGARSLDPRKWEKDIAVLAEGLEKEPGNTRYAFYLAQTLRLAGRLQEAMDAYWRRWQMGAAGEEAWHCLYQIARIMERQGRPPTEMQVAYLFAFHHRPTRAEPLFHLGRFHAARHEHDLAYLFLRRAAELPRPDDLLFIEEEIYRWRALDELCISASSIGARDVARGAARKLLDEGRLPAGEIARVEGNLQKLP